MADDKKRTCRHCGGIIVPGIISGWSHVTPGPTADAHIAEPRLGESPASIELREQSLGAQTNYTLADVTNPRHYSLIPGPRTDVAHVGLASDLVKELDELAELVYSNEKAAHPDVVNKLRMLGYVKREPLYVEQLAAQIAIERGADDLRIIGDLMFNEVVTFVDEKWGEAGYEDGLEFYIEVDPDLLKVWGAEGQGYLLPAVMRRDPAGDLILTVTDERVR